MMSDTIVAFLNWCRDGGTVGMIMSAMKRSKYRHIYLTFQASDRRREEFKQEGLELVEIGSEDIDAAVKFVKQNASVLWASNSGGPEPGVSIGLAAGVPIVETCQSPSLPSGSMHPSVAVVPVSHGITYYWPSDVKISRVIYSCAEEILPMNKFDCKNHFGLDGNRMVVGRLGRLEGLKRPQDFINSIFHIHKEMPEVQFLLAGDGNDGEGVRGMVEYLQRILPDVCVKLPGFVTGIEKQMAFNAMDVFLYPSSQEGFGISFAEAMSLGLPIVTYSDSVNVDVVGAGGVFALDNVFTDHPRPYNSLASLTTDLLRNKRDREKLSVYGKQRYNRLFLPEYMTESYDNLFEIMINDVRENGHFSRKGYIHYAGERH